MGISASAVARVVGITTQYKDMRAGNVLFLPQRIMVIAQGATAASYATTKFQATSAAQVGATVGYGSPAHLACKQLFPVNGDGVGDIPVTVYPLLDDGAATAAVGDVTPSGTQTDVGAYRCAVNNILSEAFSVAASASVTARCRALHDAISAVLDMPVTPTYTYGTPTSSAGGSNTGNGTCTSLSVTGSPTPGDYSLVCTSAVANGGVFKLVDPDGSTVATGLTMTPGAGGATVLTGGGLQFTLTDAGTDFIVGDLFTIHVTVTKVDLTSKWKGESANALYVEVIGDDLGTTWTITQPTGGATNPAVDGALAQVGNVWESMALNCLNVSDTTALDAIKTFGEGRWGATVQKPLVCFVGNTTADRATATAVSSARRTDRVNCQLVLPGSNDLPFVAAARQLARIAVVANNDPASDYGSQQATGLTPGSDGVQWDWPTRDAAVKAGSSTIEVRDGVACISDVVTMYRPDGEEPPAYRYVCDIVKLQTIIFNAHLTFVNTDWDGAPLIPDDQPTVNRRAKKPKTAKAAWNAKLDSLGLNALISDPAGAKKNTTAAIDTQNPKRMNLVTAFKLAGNVNVLDVELDFGFFFGAPAVIG